MRLIDADKLEIDWLDYTGHAGREFKEYLNHVPTIESQPVVHGKWKDAVSIWGFNVCSECCAVYEHKTNYCPHCGAKMDAEDE